MGFMITVVCAVVMTSLRAAEPVAAAAEIRVIDQSQGKQEAMTAKETKIYRIALGALLLVIFSVVALMSPWGIGAV